MEGKGKRTEKEGLEGLEGQHCEQCMLGGRWPRFRHWPRISEEGEGEREEGKAKGRKEPCLRLSIQCSLSSRRTVERGY